MLSTRYLTEFQLLGIDCDVAHLEKLVGLYTDVLRTGATFIDLTKFYRYRTLLHKIKPDSKVFKDSDETFSERDIAAYGTYVNLEEMKNIIENDNETEYVVAEIPVGLEFKAVYVDGSMESVVLKTGSPDGVDITDIARTFMPTFIDAFNGVCDVVYGVFFFDMQTYKKKYKFIYEDIKLALYDIILNHREHLDDVQYKLTNAHILDWQMFTTRADALQYIHDDIEEYQMVEFITLQQNEVYTFIEYGIYAQHDDFILDRLILLYNNKDKEEQYAIKEDALLFKATVQDIIWEETDIGRRPYAVIDEMLIHETIKVNRVNLFALGIVIKYDIHPGCTLHFKFSLFRQEAILVIPDSFLTMFDAEEGGEEDA